MPTEKKPLTRRIEALEAEVKALRALIEALITGMRAGQAPIWPFEIPKDFVKPFLPSTPNVTVYGCQPVGPTWTFGDPPLPKSSWVTTFTISGIPTNTNKK